VDPPRSFEEEGTGGPDDQESQREQDSEVHLTSDV
jgi:hypothetical protein